MLGWLLCMFECMVLLGWLGWGWVCFVFISWKILGWVDVNVWWYVVLKGWFYNVMIIGVKLF